MRGYPVVVTLAVIAGMGSPGRDAAAGQIVAPLSSGEVRKRAEKLPAELIHEVASMQYVLRPEELTALLADTDPTRCRKWIDAWWDARDPIPTNAKNEARAEHARRVLTAQADFGRGAWPGWDDRGEVMIRYGAPFGRTLIGADVLPPGIFVPAEELWYYPQFNVYARFADTGFNGFAQFQEMVDTPVSERPRSDRRNMGSKHLPDVPMDHMPIDMDPVGAQRLYPPLADQEYERFLKRVHGYYDLEEKMPAVYSFDFPDMHIPAFVAVQSFRGGDGVDRVDVSTEFESSVRPVVGHPGSRRFVTTAVFWDYYGDEIARRECTDSIGVDALAPDSMAAVVNQITMTLPPGPYRMAVTVVEDGSGRFATVRREVSCDDMDGGLAMSDLALARAIKPARDGSPFNRGAIEVIPRPSGQYRAGQPVPVYFEIYHVGANRDGVHEYAVEYTIKPVSAGRRSLFARLLGRSETPLQIRSSFDAVSPGPHDVVRFTAGTRNLPPGEFKLEVAVTHRTSPRRVVRETTFRLTE